MDVSSWSVFTSNGGPRLFISRVQKYDRGAGNQSISQSYLTIDFKKINIINIFN